MALTGSTWTDVNLTARGGSAASTTTDSNGHYSFTVLAGGNYTLTPSLTGFLFTPASKSFNSVTASQTANFTAAPAIGGTLNPQHPAKDFIRMNGRIIAVQSGS
jgi:inhibitor of cysteine peptidase